MVYDTESDRTFLNIVMGILVIYEQAQKESEKMHSDFDRSERPINLSKLKVVPFILSKSQLKCQRTEPVTIYVEAQSEVTIMNALIISNKELRYPL